MKNGPELWLKILAELEPWTKHTTIAGGCVRDYFLKVEPKDIDVFVSGDDWDFGLPHPAGFDNLAKEVSEEYRAMSQVKEVLEGKLYGHTVQIILLKVNKASSSGVELVKGFDLGITQCWFDAERMTVNKTYAAEQDIRNYTVTRMGDVAFAPAFEKSKKRFERFNSRHNNVYTWHHILIANPTQMATVYSESVSCQGINMAEYILEQRDGGIG